MVVRFLVGSRRRLGWWKKPVPLWKNLDKSTSAERGREGPREWKEVRMETLDCRAFELCPATTSCLQAKKPFFAIPRHK